MAALEAHHLVAVRAAGRPGHLEQPQSSINEPRVEASGRARMEVLDVKGGRRDQPWRKRPGNKITKKKNPEIDLGMKLDLDRVHIMYNPNQHSVVNQIQYIFFVAGNIRSGSGLGTM